MKKFKFASLALCGDKDSNPKSTLAQTHKIARWTEGRLNLISREIESKENSVQFLRLFSGIIESLVRPYQYIRRNRLVLNCFQIDEQL
jgi:hypothetical protein